MAMKSGKEYIESLKKLKPVVYAFGEKVESVVDFPMFKPHLHAAAMTYELAVHPEFEQEMTVVSSINGDKISRFTHIHHSIDDLVNKIKMMRLLGQKTATCFQRCVGFDGLNAVYITSCDIDAKHGTDYHKRFKAYMKYVQDNDLMLAGAMSDPKGDRSLRPSQQADPDMYVHVVDRKPGGVVVRGAKAHITGSVNSHEIIVMPTRTMGPDDKDYAISFTIPVDEKGVTMIFGRQTNDTRRLDGEIDPGNAKYGIVGGEALIVFDDVFIPSERVFMDGEVDFTGQLVETFAGFHRSNYGGCKVGLADVITGAALWMTENNGIEKSPYLRDLLAEMVCMAETCWSCSLACSYQGSRTNSGAYTINPLLANVVKLNITRYAYEWMRLAQDIAGGLIITLPSEKDFRNPEIGKFVDKYFKGKAGTSTIDRMRIVRLIENMAVGAGLPESMHGAGPPQAQKMMIQRRANMERKKELAETIVGIKPDKYFEKIVGQSEAEYFSKFRK
ncbi:MAG: 4-hydroxyphenylacetate 3-hydroxylase family protein [Dehalococcoidia bacterium]|nr:4-hydroxyphenylacetate 3-hydroxylase family protein [Dehalococcoidia bacterium]